MSISKRSAAVLTVLGALFSFQTAAEAQPPVSIINEFLWENSLLELQVSSELRTQEKRLSFGVALEGGALLFELETHTQAQLDALMADGGRMLRLRVSDLAEGIRLRQDGQGVETLGQGGVAAALVDPTRRELCEGRKIAAIVGARVAGTAASFDVALGVTWYPGAGSGGGDGHPEALTSVFGVTVPPASPCPYFNIGCSGSCVDHVQRPDWCAVYPGGCTSAALLLCYCSAMASDAGVIIVDGDCDDMTIDGEGP